MVCQGQSSRDLRTPRSTTRTALTSWGRLPIARPHNSAPLHTKPLPCASRFCCMGCERDAKGETRNTPCRLQLGVRDVRPAAHLRLGRKPQAKAECKLTSTPRDDMTRASPRLHETAREPGNARRLWPKEETLATEWHTRPTNRPTSRMTNRPPDRPPDLCAHACRGGKGGTDMPRPSRNLDVLPLCGHICAKQTEATIRCGLMEPFCHRSWKMSAMCVEIRRLSNGSVCRVSVDLVLSS